MTDAEALKHLAYEVCVPYDYLCLAVNPLEVKVGFPNYNSQRLAYFTGTAYELWAERDGDAAERQEAVSRWWKRMGSAIPLMRLLDINYRDFHKILNDGSCRFNGLDARRTAAETNTSPLLWGVAADAAERKKAIDGWWAEKRVSVRKLNGWRAGRRVSVDEYLNFLKTQKDFGIRCI